MNQKVKGYLDGSSYGLGYFDGYHELNSEYPNIEEYAAGYEDGRGDKSRAYSFRLNTKLKDEMKTLRWSDRVSYLLGSATRPIWNPSNMIRDKRAENKWGF